MKKIVLILSLLCVLDTPIYAQDTFFTDSLRKELKQYFVDKKLAAYPEAYHGSNLNIMNLISMEYVDDIQNDDGYEYGIYSFWGLGFPRYDHVIIRHGSEYEILEMNDMWNAHERDLTKIIIELVAYFRKHQDVPKALFPLYVDAVSRVFYNNSHYDKEYDNRSNKERYFIITDSL